MINNYISTIHQIIENSLNSIYTLEMSYVYQMPLADISKISFVTNTFTSTIYQFGWVIPEEDLGKWPLQELKMSAGTKDIDANKVIRISVSGENWVAVRLNEINFSRPGRD